MAASSVIGALRVVLGLDSAAFDSGAKKATTQLAALEKSVAGLQSNFNKLFAAMGAAGFAAFVRAGAKAGAEIEDTSEKLGISTTAFQELAYAAKLGGVDQEAFTKSFEQFNKRMGDFSGNVTDAQRSLGQLGISYESLKKQSPDEQLRTVADGFARTENAQTRARVANDLFGKSGQALINVLKEGKAGLAAWAAEANRMGVVLEEDVIKKAGKTDDEFDRISAALKAAGIRISAEFLPVLEELRKVITSPAFQDGVRELASNFASLIGILINNREKLAQVAATFAGFKVGATLLAPLGPLASLLGGATTAAIGFTVVTEAMSGELKELEAELAVMQEKLKNGEVDDLPGYQKQIEETTAKIEKLKAVVAEPTRIPRVDVGGVIDADIGKKIDDLKIKLAEARGELDLFGKGFAGLLGAKANIEQLRLGLAGLSQEQKNLLALNVQLQIQLAANAAMNPYEKATDDVKKLELAFQSLIAVQGKAGPEDAAAYSKAWGAAIQKQRDAIVQTVADIASNLAAGFKAFAEQNKKFAQAAKVAAIASALINTYQAATKALTAAPPPLNYALMAATIVAGLGQVAQIKAQNFAGGGSFKVPGGISGVDNKFVPLNLAAGEMVNITPADQVAGGSGEQTRTIELRGRRMTDFLSLEDMRDLVDGLNSAGRDGYRLKVVT